MKRQLTKREKASKPEMAEPTELADLEFVRSEVNLLVFPFFALTTKGLRRRLETEFRAVAERDGERVEILWNVSANPKYGYPGLFDRQVHRAVEQIITEMLRDKGQVENPIPLGSLYSLCQRMGKTTSKDGTYSGRVYRAIKQALERITTTSIKSEGTFYEKGKRRWTSTVFHLYDAVVFQGEELRDGQIADTNYLYLSDLYLQSLNSFYVKPLDYHYQRSLRSHIASRLYEILGVKFYGVRHQRQAEVCFKYSTLTQLLPVEQHQYLSDARKQLNPGHQELVATGFLASYEWREARDEGDWLIFYRPGDRAKDEIRRAQAERRLTSEGQEALPGMDEEFEAGPAKPTTAAELISEEDEALVAELVQLNVPETWSSIATPMRSVSGLRPLTTATLRTRPRFWSRLFVRTGRCQRSTSKQKRSRSSRRERGKQSAPDRRNSRRKSATSSAKPRSWIACTKACPQSKGRK